MVPPSLTELDEEEEAFVSRHVSTLRSPKGDKDTRGRFREDSTLLADFQVALTATPGEFLDIAGRLVAQLASTMPGTASADCVLAFVTAEDSQGSRSANILKLDADVEAAELIQEGEVIRLHVFQDLLPRPGDMQKGISWPDLRESSNLIVMDTNTSGTAKYFQNAYRIDASPAAVATENALMKQIEWLQPVQVRAAVAAIGGGGDASQVVERIKRNVPTFDVVAPELGAGGAMPGIIRSTFTETRKTTFEADDIELRLPLGRLDQVHTIKVGLGYETTIQTTTPLTPTEDSSVGSPN